MLAPDVPVLPSVADGVRMRLIFPSLLISCFSSFISLAVLSVLQLLAPERYAVHLAGDLHRLHLRSGVCRQRCQTACHSAQRRRHRELPRLVNGIRLAYGQCRVHMARQDGFDGRRAKINPEKRHGREQKERQRSEKF